MAKKERAEVFVRIAVALISGIVLYLWGYLSYTLMAINLIIALITGKRNKNIAEFVEYWSSTVYEYFRYLSGLNNRRPFPFGPIRRISKFEN